MTRSKMGLRWVGRARASFGGKLVGVDMNEVEVSTFEGRDVAEPRVVRGMGRWGEGRFEGLKVKRGKINNVSYVRDTCPEKTVGIGLDLIGRGELWKREGGERGSLVIYD